MKILAHDGAAEVYKPKRGTDVSVWFVHPKKQTDLHGNFEGWHFR